MRHELVGDLFASAGASRVLRDRRQFVALALLVRLDLLALALESAFSVVCLRVDGHTRRQPSTSLRQPGRQLQQSEHWRGCMRSGYTEHQTRGRNDAIIRAQHRARSQPMRLVRCRSQWRGISGQSAARDSRVRCCFVNRLFHASSSSPAAALRRRAERPCRAGPHRRRAMWRSCSAS